MTVQQVDTKSAMSSPTGGEGDCCPICGAGGVTEFLRAPDRFHGRGVEYLLLRCPSCSMIWLDDAPAPEEMGQHYGADYDQLIATSGERSPEHWTQRRDVLLKYKSGGVLLDLGCSSGSLLALLKGGAWELHGVEISDDSASKAVAKSGAKVFVGDVLDAPYGKESFDAITCFHVFEHVYQPQEVLRKVWEWLKPGGVFVAAMPNIDCPEARFWGTYWYPLELPRHLSHFSPTSLRNLSQKLGFEVLSLSTSRVNFLEYHLRYVGDAMLLKLGVVRTPASAQRAFSLPWRVFRKMLRLTVYPVMSRMTSLSGEGPIMQVVLRKPAAAGERRGRG